MAFPVVLFGSEGEQFAAGYTSQQWPLGTKLQLQDGRAFRFAKSGATALVAGNLQAAPANVANHLAVSVQTAFAAGDTSVSVTLGATLATADQYADGYLSMEGTSGVGYLYRIKTHPAAALSATLTLTLYSHDAVKAAATTSGTASLIANPYLAVVVNPTTPVQTPVGVAIRALAAARWGWLAVQGPANVLTTGTLILGNAAVPSTTTAGCVMPSAASTSPGIGIVMRVAAATANSVVILSLS